MKTPVLIAARNEQAELPRTLSYLDASTCDPYVIANACEDNTAEVARSFGARVWELEEAGKLPAVQHALKHISKIAVDGFIVLDADTHPFMPKRWVNSMRKDSLRHDLPALVNGGLFWRPEKRNLLLNSITSVRALQRSMNGTSVGEANMFIRPQSEEVLDEIIELPHYYPGEGRIIKSVIDSHGGAYHKELSLGALAITSDRYLRSLSEINTDWREGYVRRAPAGSRFPETVNGQPVK